MKEKESIYETNEEYVSYETAKLAKENGFDWEVHNYYVKTNYDSEIQKYQGFNDEYWGQNWFNDWNNKGEPFKPFTKDCYSAPTQALLQKWLRDKYNIHIEIIKTYGCYNISRICFYDDIIDKNIDFNLYGLDFKDFISYEKALERGLEESLKYI